MTTVSITCEQEATNAYSRCSVPGYIICIACWIYLEIEVDRKYILISSFLLNDSCIGILLNIYH
jgi:hypothetical protein